MTFCSVTTESACYLLKITCPEIRLLIHYDIMMIMYLHWPVYCYLPIWHCVVIPLCIKLFPDNETAVDRSLYALWKRPGETKEFYI